MVALPGVLAGATDEPPLGFCADASARWIHRYARDGTLRNHIGDRHRKGGFHIPNGVVDFAVDDQGNQAHGGRVVQREGDPGHRHQQRDNGNPQSQQQQLLKFLKINQLLRSPLQETRGWQHHTLSLLPANQVDCQRNGDPQQAQQIPW